MEENNGAMCGGVISQSLYDTDPVAYMMCYVLPDLQFETYKLAKEIKDKETAKKIFDKYAMSMI